MSRRRFDFDVMLVGGGVVGLLSAFLLASSGLRVSLFEGRALGKEASWAGGGIVSPLYPWRYPGAVTALSSWSQGYYPGLAAVLNEITGVDPEVHATGLYWFDLDDSAAALAWSVSVGKDLAPITLAEVRNQIAALGNGYKRALHMPGVANVRNPRLVEALRRALLEHPHVEVNEFCPVSAFVLEHGKVCGLETAGGEVRADKVVVAAGAWSGELLATLGLRLPVEPVKGQMILYKCEPGFLPAIVLAKGRYAIPRKDGHILVGSTLEHVGFDKTPTEEALASLKASAEELLPALADAEVVGHWAGLRPGSPDGIPFIGEVPQFPGLWLNCGHYRNGLVLAPASCELMKNLMLGETPIVDPAPYAPARRLGLV